MSKVQAYVYDITQGMAAAMSQALVGKQLDYVPHTGIVVFGKEYFFGGGPAIGEPGQSVPVPVYKTLDLGETSKSAAELEAYINATLAVEYTEDNYTLLHHNCNHYADAVAKFLLDGKGLPLEIVNIAAEALSTPQGEQMRVLIENMEKSMRTGGQTTGLNPFAANTGALPNEPMQMPAGMPMMPMAPAAALPAVAAPPAAAAPESEDMQAALAEIAGNDKEVQRACLSTLVKITENIDKNPVETKFRKLKTSNAAFSKKILACNGGVEAMMASGWLPDVDPEGEDVWILGDEHARSQGGPLASFKAALEKLGPDPNAAAKAAAAKPSPGIRIGTDAPPIGQGYQNLASGAGSGAGGMPGGMPGGLPPGMPPGMANNPMMQQMMNNPAMMAQAQQMANNPQAMQQAMQQLQSNPQMMQQMQQMMNDPNAMAQMQNMMGGRGGGGF